MVNQSYLTRVTEMLAELGVLPSFMAARGLTLQEEATDLVSVGLDIFGRERQLAAAAALKWTELQTAATDAGISLLLVSAFRSVDYQRRIFVRKINEGTTIEEILAVNAPPGYSQHHSGLAVDVATIGSRPLTEAFETTAAFAWLTDNAARFGFAMTYPRNNRYGFVYEPWHWALEPAAAASTAETS